MQRGLVLDGHADGVCAEVGSHVGGVPDEELAAAAAGHDFASGRAVFGEMAEDEVGDAGDDLHRTE